jgi:hypothetical protein
MHILDSLGYLREPSERQSDDSLLDQESGRRTFWLMYFLDHLAFIYLRVPTPDFGPRAAIPLPVDETSFDFSSPVVPGKLIPGPRCFCVRQLT